MASGRSRSDLILFPINSQETSLTHNISRWCGPSSLGSPGLAFVSSGRSTITYDRPCTGIVHFSPVHQQRREWLPYPTGPPTYPPKEHAKRATLEATFTPLDSSDTRRSSRATRVQSMSRARLCVHGARVACRFAVAAKWAGLADILHAKACCEERHADPMC